MGDRDPRIDPRVGDVLTADGHRWTVTDCRGPCVHWSVQWAEYWSGSYCAHDTDEGVAHLLDWRRDMASAEVADARD